MSPTEANRSREAAPRTSEIPSRRVAVAAAQVLVAADRKLGRETPEVVRRLAAGSLRRSA